MPGCLWRVVVLIGVRLYPRGAHRSVCGASADRVEAEAPVVRGELWLEWRSHRPSRGSWYQIS